MSKTPADSSGISFTALYTGAVWHRYGLSDDALATRQGRWLYRALAPFEAVSKAAIGGNLQTFLLQRHLIIDQLIDQAVEQHGVTQVLEIACGMSPRGIRLRQRHPHLHMVEADLPEMAARKALRLMTAGRLGDHHQVTPIDILAEHGEHTLEAVLPRVFDNQKPVIVVTEGLTSYFSLDVISGFWRRLAAALAQRPGSVYLSESYYQPRHPALRSTLNALGHALGGITRSQVSFHFNSDIEAGKHFVSCGFAETVLHDPRDWYDTLPIPRSRGEPLIRVVEAR
ncbi:class I SAM-dependent methyltransferase [Marinobacter salinisoli]|uniref:Class I SAM-dependent methyltransferase n=1 Tax=Marinobacter salinisoli TaxID=2769486 RepID=A0ABX7MQ18_9GAMM|nr:class I SAM-dependent methyltransferase [Marinobacter salinisoli]QSP94393.1 class I SAM-dependent methyltransferase [Marinobacter salinisoli]